MPPRESAIRFPRNLEPDRERLPGEYQPSD